MKSPEKKHYKDFPNIQVGNGKLMETILKLYLYGIFNVYVQTPRTGGILLFMVDFEK